MELIYVGIPAHEWDVMQERFDEGIDRAVHVVDGGRGERRAQTNQRILDLSGAEVVMPG